MKNSKTIFFSLFIAFSTFLLSSSFLNAQDFQGKAYYYSKTPMNLGNFGSRFSAEQKKQIAERLKNRLEKTYILTFNKEESVFKEDDKLDAISGATDSWGKNFTPGAQYKNVKTNSFLQDQEFYGKQFLVKDSLKKLKWKMGTESKNIGQYTCYKATALVPENEVEWWNFSWSNIRNNDAEEEIKMIEVEAWYTSMIPISQGPGEYWGLPGLILEVSVGSTTMLCSKIVMNPEEIVKIKAPNKGKEVTKMEYNKIITEKMKEFRDNRVGRR